MEESRNCRQIPRRLAMTTGRSSTFARGLLPIKMPAIRAVRANSPRSSTDLTKKFRTLLILACNRKHFLCYHKKQGCRNVSRARENLRKAEPSFNEMKGDNYEAKLYSRWFFPSKHERRLHAYRTSRCHCYNSDIGGDPISGFWTGQRQRAPQFLPVEHEADRIGFAAVCTGLRRSFAISTERLATLLRRS